MGSIWATGCVLPSLGFQQARGQWTQAPAESACFFSLYQDTEDSFGQFFQEYSCWGQRTRIHPRQAVPSPLRAGTPPHLICQSHRLRLLSLLSSETKQSSPLSSLQVSPTIDGNVHSREFGLQEWNLEAATPLRSRGVFEQTWGIGISLRSRLGYNLGPWFSCGEPGLWGMLEESPTQGRWVGRYKELSVGVGW